MAISTLCCYIWWLLHIMQTSDLKYSEPFLPHSHSAIPRTPRVYRSKLKEALDSIHQRVKLHITIVSKTHLGVIIITDKEMWSNYAPKLALNHYNIPNIIFQHSFWFSLKPYLLTCLMSLDVYYWVNLETLMSTLSTLWGNPPVIPISPLTPCTKYPDIHSFTHISLRDSLKMKLLGFLMPVL